MKYLKMFLGMLAILFGLTINAFATVPAEITTALADVNDVWDDVKLLIIAVGIFFVVWKFFRRGVSRTG